MQQTRRKRNLFIQLISNHEGHVMNAIQQVVHTEVVVIIAQWGARRARQ